MDAFYCRSGLGSVSGHVSVVVAVACLGCRNFFQSNHLHKTQDKQGKLPQTRARHAHARASMRTGPSQAQHPRSRCRVSSAAMPASGVDCTSILIMRSFLAAGSAKGIRQGRHARE